MTTGRDLLRRLRRVKPRVRIRGFATLAVLVAAGAASAAISHRLGLERPRGDVFLNASVAELDDSTEVVVLGSSHVFCNVRAGALSRPTVSLAMPNAKIEHLAELAEAALDRCPNLRLAIVECSAVSLLPRADRVAEFEEEKRRQLDAALGIRAATWGGRQLDRLRTLRPIRPLAQRDTLTPEWLMAHRAQEVGQRILEPGFHGWSDDSQVLIGEGENAIVHASMLGSDAEPRIDRLNALRQTLAARGVTLVLLRTPHYPSYADHQSRPMREAVKAAVAEVDVTFWDDFAREFPRDQWFDEDHLSVAGADAYTQTLNRRINDLLSQ